MAKVTGLGITTLSVDDAAGSARDVRNDITNFDFEIPYEQQEITGVDVFAYERQPLLADFKGTLNSVFNPSANRIHAVMAGDLRVVRTLSFVISAQTLNNEVLFDSYGVSRSNKGELTGKHPFSLQNGTTPTWS